MPIDALPFRLDIAEAARAIGPFIRRTPVLRLEELERPGGSRIAVKLESLQITGSFKVRGAANRLVALTPEERARGVVACSSGNHGRAVAYMAGRLGIEALICVPSWVDPVKLGGMERAGARVVLAGDTYDEAEARALEIGESQGRLFVQPFDDPWVVAGQGTLGLEMMEEVSGLTTVVVPLSGGGLAGGMAYALKEQRPDVRILAVSASRARVMYESVRAGRVVAMAEEDTLAEALSGGIGTTNRYTLALIRELVDEHVLVEEAEIRAAMRFAWEAMNLAVEGGGAVALAAVLAGKCELGEGGNGESAGILLSGGNVSISRLTAALAKTPS